MKAKHYAIIVTIILAFILHIMFMFKFTNKDMLEILVTFFLFGLPVSISIPLLLTV